MPRFPPRLVLALLAALVVGCGGPEPEADSTAGDADTLESREHPGTDTRLFVNSRADLTGARADHYIDFQVRYPDSWRIVQDASTPETPNFVKVERRSPEGTTVESFAAGWFGHPAAARGDPAALRAVLGDLEAQFSRAFAGFERTAGGVDSIAGREAPGFRFAFRLPPEAEVDRAWGRVALVPTGGDDGLALVLFATPLAEGVRGAGDVGEVGGLATVLETLTLGATPPDRPVLPDTVTPRDTDGSVPAFEGPSAGIGEGAEHPPGRIVSIDQVNP